MLHLHARSNNELYVYNGLESKRILAFLHFRHQKPTTPPRPSQTSSFACYLVPSFVVIGQAQRQGPHPTSSSKWVGEPD